MSQVIIAGDTSGTITLQAPAVSGTTTLTLPATTATLATLTTPSFASTIGVGGATASASGSGITFPATQSASSNANTLDDYEEGTWTPAFATWTTAPTSVVASYTKIGRQISISIVAFGGVCTAGSTITGIPFTASSSGPASIVCTTSSNVIGFTALIFDSASQISNVSVSSMGGVYWTCSFVYSTN